MIIHHRHLIFTLALCGLVLPLHAATTDDCESRLALDRQARQSYEQLVGAPGLSAPELADRRRWLVRRYPDSSWALRVQTDQVRGLYDVKNPQPFIAAAVEFLDGPGKDSRAGGIVLGMLAKLTTGRTAPAANKTAAVEALLPRARHAGVCLETAGRHFDTMALPPAEKWRQAKAAVEVCGYSPASGRFLWTFFPSYARAAGPAAAVTECEWFVEKFGKDSASGYAAEMYRLTWKQDAGDEAAKLAAQDKADAATVAQILAEADKLPGTAAEATAPSLLEKLRPLPARAVESRWWLSFVRRLESPQTQCQVAALAAALLPTGDVQDELYKYVLENLRLYPETADYALAYMATHVEDVNRDLDRIDNLLRLPGFDFDAGKEVKAQILAAEVSRRLGVRDAAAQYAFNAAKAGWDSDTAATTSALQRAIELAPNSSAGIEAAWFYSMLRRETNVEQGAAPRSSAATVNYITPPLALPTLAVTPFQGGTAMIDANTQTVKLAKFDPTENLAVGQIAVATSGDAVVQACDGNPATAWQPAALPAALIVPLRTAASLQRIVLHGSAPLHCTVALLDTTGRTLARYERDWSLWEQYQVPGLWPDRDVNFNLSPGAAVAYIKIEIYEALGTAGISEIEAYASPYAATGLHVGPAQSLPGALRVAWQPTEPTQEVTLGANHETARPVPLVRWRDPWLNKTSPNKALRAFGSALAMEFYGNNAGLALRGQGRVNWQLVGEARQGKADQTSPDKKAVLTASLGNDFAPGRHLLLLENTSLQREEDDATIGSNMILQGVKITGTARALQLVRFGDGKSWSAWYGPLQDPAGTVVTAPTAPHGHTYTHYQMGAFLDARAVQGQVTSAIGATPAVATTTAKRTAVLPLFEPDRTLAAENLDAVAAVLARREAVVVYSHQGSAAEIAAARRLAAKAGVYAVSDDIGLNLFKGTVVAIGTPLSNRYNRQLLALYGLWNDPQYLNNSDGLIGATPATFGLPFHFVTGETEAAILKATDRLAARITPVSLAAAPLRVFAADTLEMVYPWQQHPDRAAPAELGLRLAVNDRRNLQFGIAAAADINDLQFTAGPLTGPGGATLAAPQVRPVTNYEFVPFYGDLRLPNWLSAAPRTSLTANSATGVWLTQRTTPTTVPGLYRGTVTVQGGGQTIVLPYIVTVDAIKLPVASQLHTHSFAHVPWWYHTGTPAYEAAIRALAENEAEHGVDTLSAVMHIPYALERGLSPARFAIAPINTAVAELKWQPFGEAAKVVKTGEALFVEFPRPVAPREIGGGFLAARDATITLAAEADGVFAAGPAQKPEVAGAQVAVTLRGVTAAQRYRISSDGDFQVGNLRAFLDKKTDGPITLDLTHLLHHMDVCDAAYKARGLPPPAYIGMANTNLVAVGSELYGIKDRALGSNELARSYARQLAAALKRTGRLQRFWLKVADEPSDIAQWAAYARPFKEGGLAVMTCHSGNYPNIEAAVGTMDMWCPNYQHNVTRPFFKERQKAGDPVWWYACGVPVTRPTGEPIDNLPFFWLSEKWGFDGAANYAALHMNPANEAVPFRYDNGLDHRIAFTPQGALLDTTRRELEAEGIQDAKLIATVRAAAAGLRAKGQADRAARLETAVNAIIDKIVPYKYGYSREPNDWHLARKSLYDLATGQPE